MHNHHKTTWILVAQRTGATIYQSRGIGAPLSLITSIEHPRGRLKAGQLESDRPGRAYDRIGGGRHSLSSEEPSPDRVAHEFALRLIERVDHARTQRAFERLVLIAPPKLLGSLRSALPDALRALLVATLPKDLQHSHAEEVSEQLAEMVLA